VPTSNESVSEDTEWPSVSVRNSASAGGLLRPHERRVPNLECPAGGGDRVTFGAGGDVPDYLILVTEFEVRSPLIGRALSIETSNRRASRWRMAWHQLGHVVMQSQRNQMRRGLTIRSASSEVGERYRWPLGWISAKQSVLDRRALFQGI
jgi:hypothetical protein